MIILIIIILFNNAQAQDVDYRALELNKNYLSGNKEIEKDDFLNFDPVDLSSQFSVGAQCGQLSFKTNASAAFRKIKSQFKFRQLISSLAAASPMLLACQYSPSLCTAIQNMEQSLNFLMNFNLNQCAIIDKFTSDKAQTYNQKIADCIGAAKSRGMDSFKAHDYCVNSFTDKLASITDNKKMVTKVNVVEDSLKWMGLNDDRVLQKAKDLVGETSINHGIIKDLFGNGRPVTPFLKEEKLKKDIIKKFCLPLKDKLNIKNGVVNFAKKVDFYPLIGKNFHDRTLENLSFIPIDTRINYCNLIAEYTARNNIAPQVKEMYSVLSQALTNPNLGKVERQVLELKVKKLEAYLNIQRLSNVETSEKISSKINNEAQFIIKNIYNKEQRNFNTEKTQNEYQKKLKNKCLYSVRC